MFKLIVFVSILIAFAAADYNFQDSDFNELLFDDVTSEIDDDYLEPLRFKRGAHHHLGCHPGRGQKAKQSHCCNGGTGTPEYFEAIKEIKRTCIEEIRGESAEEVSYDPLNCEGIQAMRQQMVCLGECIAKGNNLVNENGDLKRDALLNHTRRTIGDNKWKASVLAEYVDQCLEQVKASKDAKKDEELTTGVSCDGSPLEFHHCVWKKFVEGCPADLQIDNRKCKHIRERLAKGVNPLAGKPFRHRSRHH